MKPDFDKTSTLFHSKAEVEGLYESLSKYADVNGLVISKIEKKNLSLFLNKVLQHNRKKTLNKIWSHITKYLLIMRLKAIFLGI